jgi:hypothetical protein
MDGRGVWQIGGKIVLSRTMNLCVSVMRGGSWNSNTVAICALGNKELSIGDSLSSSVTPRIFGSALSRFRCFRKLLYNNRRSC